MGNLPKKQSSNYAKTMKVAHITYTPQGGAGSAALQLVRAQQSIGLDARLITASEKSVSNNLFEKPFVSSAALFDKYLVGNSRAGLMSMSRSWLTSVDLEQLREFDLVNLHWVSGAINIRAIQKLLDWGKPVVWTMHDMRPFTGACHYSGECEMYSAGCYACPQARALFRPAVAVCSRNLTTRIDWGKLSFVSPSSGLLRRFQKSAIGKKTSGCWIPNPGDFQFERPENLDATGFTRIVFVASDVDDPRKGLPGVLEWWNKSRPPGMILEIIGANSPKYSNPDTSIVGHGFSSRAAVIDLIRGAQAIILASSDDNAPNIIHEAHALGVPIAVPNELQIGDWIRSDGAVAYSLEEINEVASKPISEEALIKMEEFCAKRRPYRVAMQYLALYSKLLQRR